MPEHLLCSDCDSEADEVLSSECSQSGVCVWGGGMGGKGDGAADI